MDPYWNIHNFILCLTALPESDTGVILPGEFASGAKTPGGFS